MAFCATGATDKRSQPVSRVLSGSCDPQATIPLGPASPQASSSLPGRHAGRVFAKALRTSQPFPIWPCSGRGLPMPRTVACRAVRSYRTFSPLPAHTSFEGLASAVIFCGTFRRLAPPRRYLASCPAETGLSSSVLPRQRLLSQLQGEVYARSAPLPGGPTAAATLRRRSPRFAGRGNHSASSPPSFTASG